MIIRKNVRGYYGMNHEAALQIGLKNPPKPGDIYVDKSLKGRMLKRTIAHEKIESYLIRAKGLDYRHAHRIAQSFEKNVR